MKPPAPPALPVQNGPASLMSVIEHLLKKPEQLFMGPEAAMTSTPRLLLVCAVVSFAVFGLLLGTFSGSTQLWASPMKVTGGILAAMLICMPSLLIFTALDGMETRPRHLAMVLLGSVALCGVLLLGFAPVLWVFSTSTTSVTFMGFLAMFFWIIGLYFGCRLLVRATRSLGHGAGGYLKVWIGIFIVVTLQMSTSLRPLIGTADTLLPTEKKFFLQHWLDNAMMETPPSKASQYR